MNWRLAICALIGHSNVETFCLGYHHCGRCTAQLGDSLAGAYRNSKAVSLTHDCADCPPFSSLTWKDRLFIEKQGFWLTHKKRAHSLAEAAERKAKSDQWLKELKEKKA